MSGPERTPLWGPQRGPALIVGALVVLVVGVILSVAGVPVWIALPGTYLAVQIYYRLPPGVFGDIERPNRRPPEDRPEWPR